MHSRARRTHTTTQNPHTGQVFPLDQFAEAVTESLKDARGGKVLIKLN